MTQVAQVWWYKNLVSDKQYVGKKQRCAFIDGSIHTFPIAEVYLDTPYYVGHVSAVVIKNPLYPLIIENILGINDSTLKVASNATSDASCGSQLSVSEKNSD